jgi:hypothetical protein
MNARARPQSPPELRDRLLRIFPEYRAHWERGGHPFIDEGGTFTYHGLMLDFTQFFALGLPSFSRRQLTELGALVNAIVDEEGPLGDAVSECFLQELRRIDVDRVKALNPFLSPVARGKGRLTDLWRDYIPVGEGLGLIVASLTVLFPLLAYEDHPTVFGEFATVKLIVLAALGGAAGMALHLGPGERWLALFPGALAGAGAAGMYLYDNIGWGGLLGMMAALAIGAAPGLLLLWALRRLIYSRRQS